MANERRSGAGAAAGGQRTRSGAARSALGSACIADIVGLCEARSEPQPTRDEPRRPTEGRRRHRRGRRPRRVGAQASPRARMGGDARSRLAGRRGGARELRDVGRHERGGVLAGDGLRRRPAARHHHDEPPRRDDGAGDGRRRAAQQGGGRAHAAVRRPGARLRLLPVRPGRRQVHAALRGAARAVGGARRRRGPRRRQRRRREDFDPLGHAGAPRPRGAGVRRDDVQRLQHLLLLVRLEHVGRLVGLAGDQFARQRDRTERRHVDQERLVVLFAARAPGARAAAAPRGAPRRRLPRRARRRAARLALLRVRPPRFRRAAAAGTARRH